jgi:PhnB protein
VADKMHISLMLAVPSAAAAADWYKRALGATELWNLGSVVGLEIEGAPFFLHEPAGTRFGSPAALGATTVTGSTSATPTASMSLRARTTR